MRISSILASGTFDDPENARIIYLAVGGLLLLAVVLSLGTWYWWRTSKVEHPALGPLEMMSTRTWRRSDFNARARQLEEARPVNAIHEPDLSAEPDELDLDALGKAEPAQFDDFSDLLPAEAAAAAVVAEPEAAPDAEAEPAAVAEEAVVEEAVVEEAVVEEPVAEEPVVEEPVVDESVVEEPVAEEPVVEEPAAAPATPGIIVIDTAPSSSPPPHQLTLDVEAEESTDEADDGQHFDPLLRLHSTE